MARLHQVATGSKEVVDRAVNRKKLLDMSQRFEAAHVAFALAGRLMGDLSPIVGVVLSTVPDRGEDSPMSRSVTTEFIGDELIGNEP